MDREIGSLQLGDIILGLLLMLSLVVINMDWTFNFRDVYDWDMNNGLGGGWVSDREMGLLHRYGVAREYEMVGSQTISIKWERGERVNAGAEILPPSFKDPRRSSK